MLRAASRLHCHSDSGYLFFVRKNGEADLYDKVDGVVVSVPGAVADPTVYHNYQVYVSGFHITCYIDGVKQDRLDGSPLALCERLCVGAGV